MIGRSPDIEGTRSVTEIHCGIVVGNKEENNMTDNYNDDYREVIPKEEKTETNVSETQDNEKNNGNTQAFGEFYEKTRGQVYGYAYRMLQQSQDAEEVVQETYLKIWKEAASYESDGKPMAWVFTIARNYCYMSLRKRQRLSEESFEELQEQEGKEEPGELCQELELAPERQTLLDALMQLNEKERQIVLLHKISGMKHREIAEIFQMPISTVLSVYHRAMKKLWERIEKSS